MTQQFVSQLSDEVLNQLRANTKPCPFCGKTEDIQIKLTASGDAGRLYCLCQTVDSNTPLGMLGSWNARAAGPTVVFEKQPSLVRVLEGSMRAAGYTVERVRTLPEVVTAAVTYADQPGFFRVVMTKLTPASNGYYGVGSMDNDANEYMSKCVDILDRLSHLADEVPAAEDYAASTSATIRGISETIETRGFVTDRMAEAIDNTETGLERWEERL